MGWGYQLLAVILGALTVWMLYRLVKGQPQLFSKENLSKSFGTLGVLALALIVFVTFLVIMVRN
jgi:uncharacterized membrane protein